ncbi:MAG: MFS transporter [Chloroflexi bacterium]|nr:MAG: MFS transporter [Chloroflexota bacterium]TMF91754.1 MAG: MFS transporter [Chloroflexota bacterium]TMG46051.1 MAG: MFS transporter [Chloroflexota bacterium]
MLMATVNATSILIAMPVIFRGININPLDPANFSYLLWLLMGYMVVSAVLVVTAGRLGDMFGRTRVYNIGFAVFTIAAVGLSLVWSQGAAGAIELIILRMVQAIGGAMVMASGAAIITDAFPSDQRGLALGINMIAGMAGSFLGILVGGVLATINWRWIFLINVPIGLIGSVWGFWQLREIGVRHRARIDWIGNVTFAAGLAMVLIGVTSGLQPYGGSAMGWGNPSVIGLVAGGLLILAFFACWETRTKEPLFHLELFRIRAFTLGNIAGLLGAVSRGGLQFMLIIWLQGIWLPLHGYDYTQTPLWAGIYMLPMTVGFLVAGPISGMLSDRYGARPFATGGMLLSALTFGLLMLLPADFWFPVFALLIFLNGVAMGLFASPNTAAIMNSVPARYRGVASGIRVTFMNVGMPLSIGLFFTLMIVGLNTTVPPALYSGLTGSGVPVAVAHRLAGLPPISYLFASFLGYNPLQTLLGPVLGQLAPADAARLTGNTFFPSLISGPFQHGLVLVLSFSIVASLVAALASALRGGRYVHEETATMPLQEAADS